MKIKKKFFLFFIVVLIIGLWFLYMHQAAQFNLFKDNWPISLMMIFGSFIAGATSEGGGAIAFPVMTLVFKIKPATARDFSLMIQSFGMMMAAITILVFQIKVLPRVILATTFGGIVGVFLGLNYLTALFPSQFVKMFFTSFWLSFGFVIILVIMKKEQFGKRSFGNLSLKDSLNFFIVGILGGGITSLIGTGIDTLTFSFLTLYFRVCPKVATPTSVILMGLNSLFGFAIKGLFIPEGMSSESINYLLVSLPIVIIGAPLGAIFINERSRAFVEKLLLTSIIVQFLGSLVIIPQTKSLIIFSFSTFVVGLVIFNLMNSKGKKVCKNSLQ